MLKNRFYILEKTLGGNCISINESMIPDSGIIDYIPQILQKNFIRGKPNCCGVRHGFQQIPSVMPISLN